MLLDTINKLLSINKKGQEWVEQVAPSLIEVNAEIKELEGKRDGETAPFKAQIKDIQDKYAAGLKVLEEIDGRLRAEVLANVKDPQTIPSPDGGKLVFAEGIEIEWDKDLTKVDPKYLVKVVDMGKVKDSLKKGITNIKGIRVVPKLSLRVYTK